MELDFDKEINALLRQAARSGEFVSTNTENHLDADDISAFAENALPEKTRNVYIKHFADCDRCRTILSNTILLNQEADIVTASNFVAAQTPEVAETKTPWYRKMFLMPNLAYTMGALVLVFGGMLGFLVLQNLNKNGSMDVAQSTNSASTARGPNAVEDQTFSEPSMANTAANAANTTANTSAAPFEDGLSSANSNSMSYNTNTASDPTLKNADSAKQKATELTDESRVDKNEAISRAKESDFQTDSAAGTISRAESKPIEENSADSKTDALVRENSPKIAAAPPMQSPPPAPAKDDAENAAKLSTAKRSAPREQTTKQVGGKTFNKVNGVWIDSVYNSNNSQMGNMALPRTKTIRRGSDEYRKLDKQLRIIAESLDAPVIILWKNGAYRIQ